MRPLLLCSLAVALSASLCAQGVDRVAGHLIHFNDNGAWSWFEDERAIVDPVGGHVLVGSCADSSGAGGSARGGDIDVAWLDLARGTFGAFELRDRLQGDDHNSPALLVRPDGRYLAMYGMHGGSGTAPLDSRWRISTRPGDPSAWQPEATFRHTRAMSYSNLFHLRQSGRTYNFVRATNFDPNVMVSTDQGTTFSGTGKLLTEGGNSDRPYLKYASDGLRRIHVLATERHPRNYDNSIYHGYVENDALYDSTGRLVDPNILDGNGQRPTQLTTVFATGTIVNGTVMRRTWTVDLAADPNGTLRALFIARANDQSSDHRLFFGRFDGTAWSTHEVCRMGAGLYTPENDYTGLGALHPDRPDTIYLSTPIDPGAGGAALGNHEIYRATTGDLGATWQFTPLTQNSSVDNLRPIVPAWDDQRTAVLWMRGTYTTYTDYDLAIVGLIDAPEVQFGGLTYIDATPLNTTLANGQPANPTGPAGGQGADDGQWHLRTGFGNNGSVWTASENGSENAPALRTRVAVPAGSGPHDVFVCLWSNPSEDWTVRAGLTPGSIRQYDKHGCQAANPTHFATAPTITGSTVRLYTVWLGRADAANGTLDVFVDDLDAGQSGRIRSWYDGIAIAPAVCAASAETTGHGCNFAPTLAAVGTPQLGGSMQVQMLAGTPGWFGLAALGADPMQPTSLAPFGYGGCDLLVTPFDTLFLGLLDPSGTSQPLSLSVPNLAPLACLRFGCQGVAADLTGSGLQLTPLLILRPGF